MKAGHLFITLLLLFFVKTGNTQVLLTADLNSNAGEMKNIAAGLLHPGREGKPHDSLYCDIFKPLKLKFVRTQYYDVAKKMSPAATIVITIGSRVWSTSDPSPLEQPNEFIEAVKSRIQDDIDNNRTIIYDFWNEPDKLLSYFGGYENLFKVYKLFYQAVKEIDPNIKITAPGYENLNSGIGIQKIIDFKDFCVANNVVPDYWNWHFGEDNIIEQTNLVKSFTEPEVQNIPIMLTEYLASTSVTYPGRTAYQITDIEESNIYGAMRAQWSQVGHRLETVSGLMIDDLYSYKKRGNWWVYQHYGQMTGKRVKINTTSDLVKGISAYDEQTASYRMLIGNKKAFAISGYIGAASIEINNIASATSNNKIKVELRRIPRNYDGSNGKQDDKAVIRLPKAVIDSIYEVIDNKITLDFNYFNDDDAYRLLITNVRPQNIAVNNYEVKPIAPSNIEAKSGIEHVVVKWNSAENALGYNVYRSDELNGNFSKVNDAVVTCATFIDNDVLVNSTYYYKTTSLDSMFNESYLSQSIAEAKVEEAKFVRTGKPIMHWKFENNLIDEIGTKNGIVQNGQANFITESKEGGYAIELPGGETFINIGHARLAEIITERTIAMWIKPNSTNSNYLLYEEGGLEKGITLMIQNNKLVANALNGAENAILSANFNSTDWNHVALIFGENKLSLYINGFLSSTVNAPAAIGIHNDPAGLGGMNGKSSLNKETGAGFKGLIDNVYIYNEVISIDSLRSIAGIEIINVDAMWLDKNVITVLPNEKVKLIANVLPKNAVIKDVVWTSSKLSVATVNTEGEVTTYREGEAIITATTVDGGITDKCTVIVSKTASTSDLKNNFFKIYPNPTRDNLYIEGISQFSYKLISVNGTVLKVGSSVNSNRIELKNLSTGFYFLEIVSDENHFFEKIIVN